MEKIKDGNYIKQRMTFKKKKNHFFYNFFQHKIKNNFVI